MSSGIKKTIVGKRLCDYITEKDMPSLEIMFDYSESVDPSGLHFFEFVSVLQTILNLDAPEDELHIVFNKIDTKSIGHVTWRQFLSYILLELKLEERNSSVITELPINPIFKTPKFVHEDIVCKIDKMPLISNLTNTIDYTANKFVTISKDGILSLWSQSMELKKYKSINEKAYKKQKKFAWPLHLVCLPNVHLIAISFSNESIKFYDAVYLDLKIILKNINANVMCMSYWFDTDHPEIGVLVLGDSAGNVTILEFSDSIESKLFGVYPRKRHIPTFKFYDVIHKMYQSVSATHLKALHDNWVKQVYYDPPTKLVMSCCGSHEISLVIHGKKQNRIFSIPCGVNCFVHDCQRNILVTGGIDRIIRIWNPYIAVKPIVSLMGHSSPINHLFFADGEDQMFSISEDKCVKVWNLVDNVCIQTINLKNGTVHAFSAAYYDSSKKIIILAAIKVIVLEQIYLTDVDDNTNFVSHSKPISGFIYSDRFNNVVSACQQGTISFWDLESGKRIFHVTKAHSELIDGEDTPKAITAVCLHESGIGLLTAGLDGYLKLWNMNNGGLEKTVAIPGLSKEIVAIVSIGGRIYFGGWSKCVISCNSELHKDSIRIWPMSHKQDILCMDALHSVFLVTGSWDGVIRICFIRSGYLHTILSLALNLGRDTFQIQRERARGVSTTQSLTSSIGKYTITPSREEKTSYGNISRLLASTSSGHPRVRNTGSVEFPRKKSHPRTYFKTHPRTYFKTHPELSPDFVSPKHTRRSLHVSSTFLRELRSDPTPIICLQCLETRNQKSPIGNLFAADRAGRIQVWDTHAPSTLMAIFSCIADEDQHVCCMTTDSQNKYLITGDSAGYIRVWYISYYFSGDDGKSANLQPKDNPDIKNFPFCLPRFKAIVKKVEEKIAQFTPVKFSSYVHTQTPHLLTSYRAHLGMIVQLALVEKKELVLTGSSDQSIRLWTFHGLFLGTFGDPRGWNLTKLITHASSMSEKKIPSDVKKVASATTLQVIRSGVSAKWRKVYNLCIIHYVRVIKKEREDKRKFEALSLSKLKEWSGSDMSDKSVDFEKFSQVQTPQSTGIEKLIHRTKHCGTFPTSAKIVLPPISSQRNMIGVYHELRIHDLSPINLSSPPLPLKTRSKVDTTSMRSRSYTPLEHKLRNIGL